MNILVSPLDWGLGHATRLIPIIDFLIKHRHNVLLCGNGNSLAKLKSTFPTLKSIEITSFTPHFSRFFPQWLAISLQAPKFLWYIFKENKSIDDIVTKEKIDVIISDNRYGLRSEKCHSYIITHQTMPRASSWAPNWFNKLLSKILCSKINKFDACLIPDERIAPYGLSGVLSDTRYVKTKIKYIGLLSQFSITQENNKFNLLSPNYLAVISGPEPQRTIFQNAIFSWFNNIEGNNIIVTNQSCSKNTIEKKGKVTFLYNIDISTIKYLIVNAKTIVCRSGYSTLMDLIYLNRTALLIPTPGQAEQEYLANLFKTNGFESKSQKKILCDLNFGNLK